MGRIQSALLTQATDIGFVIIARNSQTVEKHTQLSLIRNAVPMIMSDLISCTSCFWNRYQILISHGMHLQAVGHVILEPLLPCL